jgi:hypothetical protein
MPSISLTLLDVVAMADPSGGKTAVKRVQARSAISVIAQDPYDHVFLLESWAERCSTDRFIEKIFALNDKWRPRVFGIEANAMQTLFAAGIRREARFRALRIPVVEVWQPTRVEKPFRNRSALQPIINEGRFFTADEHVEARNELSTHPMNATFDIVDTIASAVGLLRVRPKEDAVTSDLAGLAAYLRRSGTPPSIIESEIAKRRAKLTGQTFHSVPPRPSARIR